VSPGLYLISNIIVANKLRANKLRLRSHKDIARVRNKGVKVASKNFTLVFLNSDSSASLRFAVVVSKKVSKKAVVRNLLKRRVREIMKSYAEKIFTDLLIIAKPGSEQLSFTGILVEIEKLIKRWKFN
jgi:ribonuclease P protein component